MLNYPELASSHPLQYNSIFFVYSCRVRRKKAAIRQASKGSDCITNKPKAMEIFMSNRSYTWLAPITAALILMCTGCVYVSPSTPQFMAVQSVADSLSQEHYKEFHFDIESMGLGLYGGSKYDMGYRNRDYHKEDGPTLGNQEARMYIQDAFKAMGLSVSVQGTYKNVVAELKGTKTPEKIYILGAHYDHLKGDRPGGDDNASGTAGLLEAARVLSKHKFASTIRFVAFNAEEDGRRGSKDYVAKVAGSENIVGMINMDMIFRPGSDARPDMIINVEVETKGSMPWVKAYVKAVGDYVPCLAVGNLWNDQDSTSDNDSFQAVGIPAMLIIENSFGDWYPPDPIANSYYHKYEDASDRLANDPNSPSGVTYDYAFATNVVRGAVALFAQEAKLSH